MRTKLRKSPESGTQDASLFSVVGTPRCGVPAAFSGGTEVESRREVRTIAPPNAARTAQRAVPTTLNRDDAFSLLEVMVALGIFFACVFSILALVSRGLQQARALQPMQMDAKTAIAMLSLTNRLEEGPLPPEIIKLFETAHPNATVGGEIYEVATNGLFRVDFTVGSVGGNKRGIVTESSILLFRPLSQSRAGAGAGLRR
jgi:hypothetical protein